MHAAGLNISQAFGKAGIKSAALGRGELFSCRAGNNLSWFEDDLAAFEDLWVIRTLSALGIKDFRGVLLGMLRGVTAPPIDHAEAV